MRTNTDHLDAVGLLEKFKDLTNATEEQINTLSPREIVSILKDEDTTLLIDLYDRIAHSPDEDNWSFNHRVFKVDNEIRHRLVEYCNRHRITLQKLIERAILRYLDHQGYYLEVMTIVHPYFIDFLEALWELSTVDGKIIPSTGLENCEKILREIGKISLIDIEKSLLWFRSNGFNRDQDILEYRKNKKKYFGHGKKFPTRSTKPKPKSILTEGYRLEKLILGMVKDDIKWEEIVHYLLRIQTNYFPGEKTKIEIKG